MAFLNLANPYEDAIRTVRSAGTPRIGALPALPNDTDAFGRSGVDPLGAPAVQKPYDPNDEPNPANPGGISNNQLASNQRDAQRAETARLASVPYGTGPEGSPTADGGTVQPGQGGTAAWWQVDRTGEPEYFIGPLGDRIKNPKYDPNNIYQHNDPRLIQGGATSDPAAVSFQQASQSGGPNVPGNPGPLTGLAPNQGTPNPGGAQPIGRNSSDSSLAFVGGVGGAIGSTVAQGAAATAAGGADVDRIIGLGNNYAANGNAAATSLAAQGAAAVGRQAPQIVENGQARAGQQGVLGALESFQPNTSGVSGIRNATADISGAGNLEAFQGDPSGIQSLDEFGAFQTQQGVNALRSFQAVEGRGGAEALERFDPTAGTGAAAPLSNFQTSTGGVQGVQDFAAQSQGPSAAEALLRLQSERDQQSAIALARSARGGPAAVAAAMRRAQASNAATQQETRMQGAVLSAQEKDTFEARRLQALVAAGGLISQADGQRLQALSDAGQILSAADAQRLSAFQAAAQARTQMDAQQLGALTASGNLQASADQQRLGAATAAGQLRAQNDSNRVQALSSAANTRIQGSQINQQGQIAATGAELQGSALEAQNLTARGQLSTAIRDADISVLRSNMDATLQQTGLDDVQVRTFAQMGEDARQAGERAQLDAEKIGLDAATAQRALEFEYGRFAWQQMTDAQQIDYQDRALAQGLVIANDANDAKFQESVIKFIGGILLGAGAA